MMFWKRKPKLKAPPAGTTMEMQEATAIALRDRIRVLQGDAYEQFRLSDDHRTVAKEKYADFERYRDLADAYAQQGRVLVHQREMIEEMLRQMHE